MLQIARQCNRPNVVQEYLTFGEFCVFVKTLQTQQQQIRNNQSKFFNKYYVLYRVNFANFPL